MLQDVVTWYSLTLDLLALLKWKGHPERVLDILARLRHVSGEDVVKFLQDILDTLFSILDDNTDKYGPLVFQSLVFIINLLRDSKFYHFRPVMDTYIQKHFAGALAYKELIRCLKWYMDRSSELIRQDPIQETMRALEYIFKFIVQSRLLYSRATCGQEEEEFHCSVHQLFTSLRFVLSLDARHTDTLLFSQPGPVPPQPPGPPLASCQSPGPVACSGPAPGSSSAARASPLSDHTTTTTSTLYTRTAPPYLHPVPQDHHPTSTLYTRTAPPYLHPEHQNHHPTSTLYTRATPPYLHPVPQDHHPTSTLYTRTAPPYLHPDRTTLPPPCTPGPHHPTSTLNTRTAPPYLHPEHQNHHPYLHPVHQGHHPTSTLYTRTAPPLPPPCTPGLHHHSVQPAALLSSFPAIFEELLQVFSVQEVCELVRGALGCMPSTLHMGHSMDVVRLQSIARTVDSPLFAYPESRRILLPVVLHHIHLHLRQQKELLICSGILSSIFSIIKTSSLDSSVQEEVEMMVESLLDVLLQTLLSIMSKSQSQEAGEYVSCLLSLLRQMSDTHFQHLLDSFQSKEELKEFVLKILCVFRNLMKLSIFPRDWNVMRLLTSNIIVSTARFLSPAIHKHFNEADFDFKVWSSYFGLAVLYINQPSLQLESLSPAKRKKVLDKHGDMRIPMAYELLTMWQNLGENKVHFIPGMIGPFLGVTLVPQAEVRNIMIPLFHDMMDWEQRTKGHFKQVEAELIDKLDSLVSEGKGDENYRELFSLLTQLFGPYPSLLEKVEQETWRESGISFVTSVTRLMERLLDYRDCMKGDETENKKIGCTVNLLNFYKSEINKEEMYIRYIHKLCDMYLQADNYTEAAFTLLLYWEQLSWEEGPLRDFLHYPAQTHWHRKEALCRKVLHYFNKAKCWEYGIPLCRELAFQYESLYDYQSLSWIRKMEAAYYDNIMEQQRLEPEFFRIGFYGRNDTGTVGNVVILAEGLVLEHPDDFYRMQPSPSSSSLSSTHSAPSQMIHSAPSTIRVGSPSLPDRFRHNRELMMLLPPHRDRPSSVMIPSHSDHAQPSNLQRALFHQVIGPCKPCSDPNLSVAEKVLTTPSSWSLDSGTRETLPFLSGHLGLAPPVPPRNLPPGNTVFSG
ncbi:unnamed protein product [Arctogadus glacialis]